VTLVDGYCKMRETWCHHLWTVEFGNHTQTTIISQEMNACLQLNKVTGSQSSVVTALQT